MGGARWYVVYSGDGRVVSAAGSTGLRRSGEGFGLEHWGVQPHLVQCAKAITSG